MSFISKVLVLSCLLLPIHAIANYMVEWDENLLLVHDNHLIHLELTPDEFENSNQFAAVQLLDFDGFAYFASVVTDVGAFFLTFCTNQEYHIAAQELVTTGIGYY